MHVLHCISWMLQEIYGYAYGFTLEKGKKCLPQEVAIEMWRLIFSPHPWPLLESWYESWYSTMLDCSFTGHPPPES